MRKSYFTLVRFVFLFTALEEIEMRKKDKILAEKVRMEMDQKTEEVVATVTALQQKNMVLEDRIRQKTAKKENLVSKMIQVLIVPGIKMFKNFRIINLTLHFIILSIYRPL
jgi:hypothetical protein